MKKTSSAGKTQLRFFLNMNTADFDQAAFNLKPDAVILKGPKKQYYEKVRFEKTFVNLNNFEIFRHFRGDMARCVDSKTNLCFVLLSAHKNSSRSFLLGENVVNRFQGKKSLDNQRNKGMLSLIFQHLRAHFGGQPGMQLEAKLSMIEIEGHYGYDLLFNCRGALTSRGRRAAGRAQQHGGHHRKPVRRHHAAQRDLHPRALRGAPAADADRVGGVTSCTTCARWTRT